MSDSNTITVKLLDELNKSNECELIISSKKTSQNSHIRYVLRTFYLHVESQLLVDHVFIES